MDADGIAHALAHEGLAHRGFLADEALERILAQGGDELDGLFVTVLILERYLVKESHAVGFVVALDDHGGLDHVLQVANAAVVAVFLALCGLVLEVLAQVPEGTGDLHLFDELRPQVVDAVLQLRLHLVDVYLGQFVMHCHTPLCSLRWLYSTTAREKGQGGL